jgi:hypothetical protein
VLTVEGQHASKVGLVGSITSHISISVGIKNFGIAHGLRVTDQVVQVANYLNLYMPFMIALFVFAMFLVVQASILFGRPQQMLSRQLL